MRAAISESQNHLSVLEIAKDESQEPLRDLKGDNDPHNNIVVYLIKGFRPVSQQIENSLSVIGIVSILEDKVDDGDEGMGARGPGNSILRRVIEFCYIEK